MQLNNIGLIGLMGPRGSNKTEKMHGLEAVLTSANTQQNGGIRCVEMSDIIKWGLSNTYKEFETKHTHGRGLPDDVVNNIFLDWIRDQSPFPRINLLIIAGIPWGERQNPLLSHFERKVIIHSETDREKSEGVIVRDHMQKPLHVRRKRRDDGESDARAHWNEYIQIARPGLTPLNGNVLSVDNSAPLQYQLEKILVYLRGHHASPLPKRRALRAIGRLHTPSHPCHEFIRSLETGSSTLRLQTQN